MDRNYRFDPAQYNTHMLLLEQIQPGTRVLEIGTASGYLGQYLVHEKKCVVWGVEPVLDLYNDAQSCGYEKLFHSSVEDFLTNPEVQNQQFDAILMGDVLEHTVDPTGILVGLRTLLKPTGYAVISLPNIAHYSTRFGLLKGKWDMADGGILDRTHLRFFTLKTMKEMIEKAGYTVDMARPSSGYIERFGLNKLFGIGRKVLFTWPTLFAVQFILRATPKK